MKKISYFRAPIKNVIPCGVVSVQQLHKFITRNAQLRQTTEMVRASEHYDEAKKQYLPFVTPCGTFSRRKADCLLELSGLLPIDIDKLSSRSEAEALRHELFADVVLQPALCYVSPSARGVKAFVPYRIEDFASVSDAIRVTMEYVRAVYGSVDISGKDVCRSCFLCHDEGALLR